MLEDDDLWRPPPPSPYRSTGRTTRGALNLLSATAAFLRSISGREAACLWLGTFTENRDGAATVMVIPKQVNRARNYDVPVEAVTEVASWARPRGLTVVAAVHSHPSDFVEHSRYDDEMTPSRRAVSLVFPNYGWWNGPWNSAVGVHEYIDNYWHLLPVEEVSKRLIFEQGLPFEVVDLR